MFACRISKDAVNAITIGCVRQRVAAMSAPDSNKFVVDAERARSHHSAKLYEL
jgi:hypothetical protein